MKIRYGFVSNSSSSSFICDICGRTESGWDLCLSEAEMCECVAGHTFCSEDILEATAEELCKYWKEYWDYQAKVNEHTWHSGQADEVIKSFNDIGPGYSKDDFVNDFKCADGDGGQHYEIASILCPLCQHEAINKAEGFEFLKKHFSLTDEQVLELMKASDD